MSIIALPEVCQKETRSWCTQFPWSRPMIQCWEPMVRWECRSCGSCWGHRLRRSQCGPGNPSGPGCTLGSLRVGDLAACKPMVFSIFLCLFFRCLPIYCTHLYPWYAIKTYFHILSLSCSYACVEPHSAFALLKRMPAHLWWIEEIASLEAEGNQSALQAGALSGMSHEGVACQHAIPPAQQAIAGRNLRCVGRSSCSSSEDVEISRGLWEAFKEPFDFQALPVVSASLRLSQPSLWHTLVAYW